MAAKDCKERNDEYTFSMDDKALVIRLSCGFIFKLENVSAWAASIQQKKTNQFDLSFFCYTYSEQYIINLKLKSLIQKCLFGMP